MLFECWPYLILIFILYQEKEREIMEYVPMSVMDANSVN